MIFGNPLTSLVAIGVMAVVLSAITYQFFEDAAERIIETSRDEARTTAKVQAHDLANSLQHRFEDTLHNLQVIAYAPPVQEPSLDRAKILFRHSQNADREITDYYGWVDPEGKVIWSTLVEEDPGNSETLGADRSGSIWFIEARDTRRGYASHAVSSVDDERRLYLSYPVTDSTTGAFNGVVYAAIPPQKVNNYLSDLLYPEINTSLGLLDTNGVILHATYPELLGLNYFSEEYQLMVQSSPIKADDPSELQQFVRQSLGEGGENSIDLSYGGAIATTAYSSVNVEDQRFMMLYTRVPHVIAGGVADQVDQQRIASWLLISIIGAAAALVGVLTISWNKRLESDVAGRTSELDKSNKELMKTTRLLAESNEKLRMANEHLMQNDKVQREFINIAAHELRTPIQPLMGVADLISRQFSDSSSRESVEVTKPEIEMIVRNAGRLERLSSDILQVAKMESGQLSLDIQKFDIGEEIRNVVDDVKATLQSDEGKKRVAIVCNCDSILVDADRSKISEVLSNLIQNAVKFTKEGEIIVSAERSTDGRSVIVRVTDEGSGIDQEIMPRLFSKFTSRSISGTGLGLFISRKLVEAHGGKIWGMNNKSGRGATFCFTLPIAPQREYPST